jgi:hypothetical protein
MVTTKLLMWNNKLIYTKPIVYDLAGYIIMLLYFPILPIHLDSMTYAKEKVGQKE